MTSLQVEEGQMEYNMIHIGVRESKRSESGVETELTSVQGHYLPHRGQTG
jgi:hypothetical protein